MSLQKLNLIVLKIMLRVSVCGKYFLHGVCKLINAYSFLFLSLKFFIKA